MLWVLKTKTDSEAPGWIGFIHFGNMLNISLNKVLITYINKIFDDITRSRHCASCRGTCKADMGHAVGHVKKLSLSKRNLHYNYRRGE